MADYDNLLEYCNSDSQTATVQACIDTGSTNKAAKKLGKSAGTIGNTLERIRKNASRRGWSPSHDMNKPTAPGYAIKGTSTLYDEDGKVKIQWVKTNADAQAQLEQMQDAIEAMKEDLPVYKLARSNTKGLTNKELLNCYVLSDYHLGMIAWQMQTGDEDWNTAKAEQFLYDWFSLAIERAPKADKCLFIQLGDFTHADNQTGTTPRSGHVLDIDVPMNMIINVAVRAMHNVIHLLAAKYSQVSVIVADGNHDETGAKWLSSTLAYQYKDCEHISIDNTAQSYYCYEFGDVSVFAHHGHCRKMGNVSEAFVAKFRPVFGRTSKSYAHMGHYHHSEVKENSLMIVEQHRTLAAKDNYASQGGYASGRSASVITYHKSHGEVGRITISRDMVA